MTRLTLWVYYLELLTSKHVLDSIPVLAVHVFFSEKKQSVAGTPVYQCDSLEIYKP
jgi:hypothetical protein